MKNKILAFLTALVVGFVVLFPFGNAYADDFQETKPTYSQSSNKFSNIDYMAIIECVRDLLVKYVNRNMGKIDAARAAYFHYIITNMDNCTVPMLNGDRFNDDYIYHYFKI